MKCAECGKMYRGTGSLMPVRTGFRVCGKGAKPEGRYQTFDDGMPGTFGHVTYAMWCKDCLEKRPRKSKTEEAVEDYPF